MAISGELEVLSHILGHTLKDPLKFSPHIPSGCLTVRHGKIHPFLIGKPSISMGRLYHGYVT